MSIKEASRLSKVTTYYFAKKLAEIDKMNSKGKDKVINLGIGSPDIDPPSEVVERLHDATALTGAHKYQSYRGIPSLRKAYAEWYKRHFNVSIDGETEILPLIGSKEGIMHISMTYLDPGDKVLVPDPGYPAYTAVSQICQAEVIKYKLSEHNNWLPNLDVLASRDLSDVKIMWINYPHMPTGAKANLKFFHDIVEFGNKHNILICHDNPYTFILNGDPLSLLQIPGAKETCLELTSLSKNYNMAGWRVGAITGKSDYINSILKFKSNMDSGMFRPLQEAAIVALNQGADWHRALNDKYIERRVHAWRIMDTLGCKYDKDAAGLFVWGRIPEDVTHCEELSDRYLYNAKVFITPGHIFGDAGKRYLRISLCADLPALEEAYARIVNSLNLQEI